MTSYKRKDYGDEKVSDDENEPLTFLSGTKRIQIQVIHYNLLLNNLIIFISYLYFYKPIFIVLFFLFHSRAVKTTSDPFKIHFS